MNEIHVVSPHQPATKGPGPKTTDRAARAFLDYLGAGASALTPRRWRSYSLAITGAFLVLLAMGGVAVAVMGGGDDDGVVQVEPATDTTQVGDLTLVVQE